MAHAPETVRSRRRGMRRSVGRSAGLISTRMREDTLRYTCPVRFDRPNTRVAPRGFTLVELLVVIAIIGILVALLLPAIQSARAAARRSQCQNNLKQIGIALLNYHNAKREFPEGMYFDVTSPTQIPPAADSPYFRPNWIIKILPFMEEQAIYDRFDFKQYISHANNREVRGRADSDVVVPGRCGG